MGTGCTYHSGIVVRQKNEGTSMTMQQPYPEWYNKWAVSLLCENDGFMGNLVQFLVTSWKGNTSVFVKCLENRAGLPEHKKKHNKKEFKIQVLESWTGSLFILLKYEFYQVITKKIKKALWEKNCEKIAMVGRRQRCFTSEFTLIQSALTFLCKHDLCWSLRMNILEKGRGLNPDREISWAMIIVVGQVQLCCNHKVNNLSHGSFTYGCLRGMLFL